MAKGLIQRVTWRSTTLLLFETVLIVSAVLAAVSLRFGPEFSWVLLFGDEQLLLKALLVAYVCQLSMYYCDLYDDVRIAADRRELLLRIFQALSGTSIVLALLYYLIPSLELGRGVVIIAGAFIVSSVVAWRLIFAWLSMRIGPRERLLLVGTGEASVELARELHQRPARDRRTDGDGASVHLALGKRV